MPVKRLLLLLFALLLSLSPLHSHAAGDIIEYGVSLPIPEGYAEIRRDEFPEFYDAMALESYLAYDDLARIFLLQSEIPFLREGNFDAISAMITAVIFKPESRKNSDTFLQKMADAGGSPYAELNAVGRLFYPVIAMSHSWSMRDRKNLNAPDIERMKRWFAKTSSETREPLAAEVIARESGFGIATWLQERNDYYSYGIIGPGPQCMTFAFAVREKERIGLVFAVKAASAEEALTSIALARKYVHENGNAITLKKIEPQIRQSEGLRVLLSAGLHWQENMQYAGAADVYERWAVVADTLRLAVDKFTAISGLSTCLLGLGRTQEVLDRFPVYLDECNTQLGPEDRMCIFLQTDLGIAKQMQGQISAALSDYEAARGYALGTLGPFSPESLRLDYLIAGALTAQGRFDEGRALYKDALSAVTESREPKRAGTYWLKLSELEALSGNARLASLYSKIGLGIVWYTVRSSKLLANTASPEFWELEPLLPPKGGPEHIPDEARAYFGRQNSAIDTPWNKSRDLMKGPEVKLYSRYGDMAAALHNAGESGTEREKERARADFRNWLDEVEKALR